MIFSDLVFYEEEEDFHVEHRSNFDVPKQLIDLHELLAWQRYLHVFVIIYNITSQKMYLNF